MTDTEVVVVTPETKQKPDMTKVREAKKRKQQERDTMLSDLSKQVSVLGNTMKAEVEEETDGPVVVTKKKQKVEDGPSLKSEVFKAVMVGALGLATWYVNSVMFVKKQEPLLDRIQALPITPITPLPVVPVTPLSMPPPIPPKKKIGASGLLE